MQGRPQGISHREQPAQPDQRAAASDRDPERTAVVGGGGPGPGGNLLGTKGPGSKRPSQTKEQSESPSDYCCNDHKSYCGGVQEKFQRNCGRILRQQSGNTLAQQQAAKERNATSQTPESQAAPGHRPGRLSTQPEEIKDEDANGNRQDQGVLGECE